LPPTGPLLLVLFGLLLWRRRVGRWLVWGGFITLFALASPLVAQGLLSLVDDTPPLDYVKARTAQAIVIMGGGVRNAPEYGGDSLGRLTLERVRYGAWVARRTGLPVMVTGGSVFGGTSEAEVMRAALQDEFGVPVRWIEPRSRNTHQNAQLSAAELQPAGIKRIVLVAHSFDMPRAQAEFEAAGFETILAPTGVQGEWPEDLPLALLLVPNMAALHGSYYALYELLAEAVRRIGLNG
ncbi:MAG TPA: YdcF family protein, partial [Burkholderiales bacterium]